MKNALLIIGEDIGINSQFLDYAFNSYKEHFGELGEFRFIGKNDKDLPFAIENLSIGFDSLCIFASLKNYAVAAKILATLSGDSLELKNGEMLAPVKAHAYIGGGFLLRINDCDVNLLLCEPTRKIPEIKIKAEKNFEYFCLVDLDEESGRILLDPLAKTYDVRIHASNLIENIVLLKAEENKFGQIQGFMQGVKNLFSQKLIIGKDIIEFIAKTLIENNLKVTFAESCTAGLAAAKFGSFSGVSAAFDGSLVTYANDIKRDWLGVDEEILRTYGAVSEECVRAMLSGAVSASGADFALAISGIAGPDGGSETKPVGTVYVGVLAKNGKSVVERLNLKGNRNYIREQSVLYAFAALLRLKPELFFKD